MLINKKIDKNLKKELKKCKKEKIRCAKQYDDWKDDDYNCGPLKFIWGLNTNSVEEPNFRTLNVAYIYYNRDNGLYFLDLDGELNEFNRPKDDLLKLNTYFTEWVQADEKLFEEAQNFNVKENLGSIQNLYKDMLTGKSIAELYYKFKLVLKGLV